MVQRRIVYMVGSMGAAVVMASTAFLVWRRVSQMACSAAQPIVTFSKLGSYGKLGNQLFQIAAVRHIAHVMGAKCVLPTSTKQLPLYKLFDLDHFEFSDPPSTHIQSEQGPTAYAIPASPLANGTVLDLNGYFQHRRYLSPGPLLRLRPTMQKLAHQYKDHIGIHIRRGDYLNLQHLFIVPPLDYYARALDIVANTVGAPANVIVCSDDIAWCKDNIAFENPAYQIEFSPYSSEVDDFAVLAGCKAMVMSASTFSWWAAHYGNKRAVVMPWPWFVEDSELGKWNNPRSFVEKGWIALSHSKK